MEDDSNFLPPKKIRKLDSNAIQKLVDEAPEVCLFLYYFYQLVFTVKKMEELTEQSLKKLILQLEKKINTNQHLRTKFPDKPEK